MIRSIVVIGVMLAAFALSSGLVGAQNSISDFQLLRDDMELAKGAIKQTVGDTVLNTYIPGFGVVFTFTVAYDEEEENITRNIERAIRFLVPSLERLAEDEKVVLVGQREGLFDNSFLEIIYITSKANAADPDSWEIFINRK